MSIRLLRPIIQYLESITKNRQRAEVPPPSSREVTVMNCQRAVEAVQEKLHLKYQPLAAHMAFVRTMHPNIEEYIKFLKRINHELSAKKPQLLSGDFPPNISGTSLDSLFVSRTGHYIPTAIIADFVLETNTLLEHAAALAQAESGTEEYHFRMLSKTIDSLTSIHGAISTVLAE